MSSMPSKVSGGDLKITLEEYIKYPKNTILGHSCNISMWLSILISYAIQVSVVVSLVLRVTSVERC